MLCKTSDLTPYLYMPSKGITLAISSDATSKANISTGDAQMQLLKSEAKINQAFGEIEILFTRVATAVTAGATAIVTDTIDKAYWDAAGAIYYAGQLASYTEIKTIGFSALVAVPAVGIPAAPVGAVVIAAVNDSETDIYQRQEAAIYRRIELIAKDAAYELWKGRFPADDTPNVTKEWRVEVDRAITAAQNGTTYANL